MLQKLTITCIFFISVVTSLHAQASRAKGELLVELTYKSNPLDLEKYLNSLFIQTENISAVSERLNIWLVQFNEDEYTAQSVMQDILSWRGTSLVQYNHTLDWRNNVPDDASFSLQWNMLNTASGGGGVEDADIDADEAWDITTGGLTAAGDTIVIAIVDEGFDLAHIDLTYWKNNDEIIGNGIDDDANGYIDDREGWNAITHNGVITSATHGTHVSGIAGAIGDNEIGVAGVNWHVKIMPVITDVIESQVIEAYSYVFTERELYNLSGGTKGSFVVSTNSSFGIDAANPVDFPLWCAMYDSLGSVGILSAAATTNANINVDVVGDMPTACTSDYLISVTNTNKFDELISGGYGPSTIDLGAPGTSIYSTIPGNAYNTQTGTSMSSPHVAGAVALLMSDACFEFLNDYKTDPGATILQIKNYIMEGVDTLTDLTGITVSNGRLNIYNALLRLQEEYCFNAIENAGGIMSDVTVFPNPADDKLFIAIKDNIYNDQLLKAEMMNVLGETILSTGTMTPAQLQFNGISLQGIAEGTYFICIYDKNARRLFSTAIIIQ